VRRERSGKNLLLWFAGAVCLQSRLHTAGPVETVETLPSQKSLESVVSQLTTTKVSGQSVIDEPRADLTLFFLFEKSFSLIEGLLMGHPSPR